ncbi:redoxin domain-containing protein [Alienimonas chondri]|uniref:Thiol-disulfide oxidoreductase ResA n=1 Tax=Alienimonas chondri TaxID=2681879 RepID=A0ABX1VHU7_9PLAN|nr:redoxin domain-containing protein [Alienimonas chondri]NNJ26843.1 Thiol-disulfide oxidoreductase ResA [Alienimonas chondri]
MVRPLPRRPALRGSLPSAGAALVAGAVLGLTGCGEAPVAAPVTTAPTAGEASSDGSTNPGAVMPENLSRDPAAEGASSRPSVSSADPPSPAADAEVAAVLSGLPSHLQESFAELPELYAARSKNPEVAARAATELQRAGIQAMDFHEHRGYALLGYAGEAAAAAGDQLAPEQAAKIFYHAACANSRIGEATAATAFLDRAAAAGFAGWEQAATDPDLEMLREIPGFEARLTVWKETAADASTSGMPSLASTEPSGSSPPPSLGGPSGEQSEGLFPFDFAYQDINGGTHQLSAYQGNVVVVDFWGTWCPPCRAEIPSFIQLQQRYAEDGLRILGLNYRDDVSDIREFVAEYGINYPTGPGSDATRAAVPNFRGYPTTVFVGRDGTVREVLVGAHSLEKLEGIVTELLAETVEPESYAEWPEVPEEPKLTDLKRALRLSEDLDAADLRDQLEENWERQFEDEPSAANVVAALNGLVEKAEEAGGTAAIALPPQAGETAAQIAAAFPDLAADGADTFAPLFVRAAAALEKRNDSREALTFLERAAEVGWTDWDALAADPAFKSLREDDDYQERLARWTGPADAGLSDAGMASSGAFGSASTLPPAEQALADLAAAESFPYKFIYRDLDDGRQRLADYEGKVVVAHYWNTGSEAAREEIPHLIALQTEHGEQGLQVLGLNYEEDSVGDVEAFVAEQGVNYPVGIGNKRAQEAVPGFSGYPTTVFVGRDGEARLKVAGPKSKAYLEAVATALLEEPAEESALEPASESAPAD